MTTEEFAEFVERLLKTEDDLNKILYLGQPVGGLFSKFLFRISQDRRGEASRYETEFQAKFIFKTIANFYKFKFKPKGRLLIIKTNERESHNRLMNPIIEAFKHEATVFSNRPQNADFVYKFVQLPALGFADTIKAVTFVNRNFAKVRQIFKDNNIEAQPPLLFFTFLRQIFMLHSTYNILKKSKIKLVVCDYDRNPNTNFFILAARALNIKTVTLVHGAIYPPYGFAPLIADEIWCWGKFQKDQLITMGVDAEKIKITGNPMGEVKILPETEKINLKNHYNITENQTVAGLALHPIGQDNNSKMINFVLDSIPEDLAGKIIILAKPHPKMKAAELEEVFYNHPSVRIFDSKAYSVFDFFALCDVVISRGSSIGYESVMNDVPSILIDYDDSVATKGNMNVMAESMKSPIFTEMPALKSFFATFAANPQDVKAEILQTEKEFIFKEYYYKIGEEADKEAINKLKAELKA